MEDRTGHGTVLHGIDHQVQGIDYQVLGIDYQVHGIDYQVHGMDYQACLCYMAYCRGLGQR